MRSQLLRAASRARRPTGINGPRSFSSTVRRSAEVELTVDGKKVSIEAGSALIQACEKAGVTIPRYCYHEWVDSQIRSGGASANVIAESFSLLEIVECA